jgi:hypothetical protein
MAVVNAKLAQTAEVSSILTAIFAEPDAPAVPAGTLAATTAKLPLAYLSLLQQMAERPIWARDEYESLAAGLKLMPDGAIDIINERAFELAGSPVLEGDDPIEVDVAIAKELCS